MFTRYAATAAAIVPVAAAKADCHVARAVAGLLEPDLGGAEAVGSDHERHSVAAAVLHGSDQDVGHLGVREAQTQPWEPETLGHGRGDVVEEFRRRCRRREALTESGDERFRVVGVAVDQAVDHSLHGAECREPARRPWSPRRSPGTSPRRGRDERHGRPIDCHRDRDRECPEKHAIEHEARTVGAVPHDGQGYAREKHGNEQRGDLDEQLPAREP